MNTTTVLVIVGIGAVALVLYVRSQPQAPTTAQTAAGLLTKVGSWWNANYEFGF